MKFRAYTVEPEEFERWAQHQVRPAVFPAPVPVVPSGAGVALQEGAVADEPAGPAPYWFPKEQLPAHVIPTTKLPAGLTFDEALLAQGDAERGRELYSRSSCIGCHAIKGNPMSVSNVGPNLTHVATRHTIASGLYPNDAKSLALWIKNAPAMKPGSLMPTIGIGERDPVRKNVISAAMGGLTDAQIADIVAYLQALQ
jgi:cytochrome c oxidase subunit 2